MVVCDICRKPSFTHKFDMPRNAKYHAMMNGKVVDTFTKLEKTNTDLCSECAKKIADLFEEIRVTRDKLEWPYDES